MLMHDCEDPLPYLMFLSLPPLLLYLLLLLQLLGDARLSHGLLLGPLVGPEVQGRLQSGGATGAVQDLGPELSLELQQAQRPQLDHGTAPVVVGHYVGVALQLVDTMSYTGLQPDGEQEEFH